MSENAFEACDSISVDAFFDELNWRISQWPNRCSEDNDSEEEKNESMNSR